MGRPELTKIIELLIARLQFAGKKIYAGFYVRKCRPMASDASHQHWNYLHMVWRLKVLSRCKSRGRPRQGNYPDSYVWADKTRFIHIVAGVLGNYRWGNYDNGTIPEVGDPCAAYSHVLHIHATLPAARSFFRISSFRIDIGRTVHY